MKIPNPVLTTTRVLRLRLKDKHARWLSELAREVNFVWNYCNETSHRAIDRHRKFLSGYDLDKLTAGATKEGLNLHSQTVQAICAEYATRRTQFKKDKLRWRASTGSRRSLGWIPFKASAIRYRNGQVLFGGRALSLWDSYGLADYVLGAGSISEDSRGRWYFNTTVKVVKRPCSPAVEANALGIDLGLKDLMASSDGEKVEAQQFYRHLEPKLAIAQRAGNKKRMRALHAKIANRRKDHLHQLSTRLVKKHAAIFVGDVNARALAQTSMAKSVLDAGWSAFRTMLQYKCDDAGVWFHEVDERFSTQECSSCHARTGPKGREGLAVRTWTCTACSTTHDRDTNAALNIKARGLVWLDNQYSMAEEAQADSAVNKAKHPSLAEVGHGLPDVESSSFRAGRMSIVYVQTAIYAYSCTQFILAMLCK